MNNAKVIIDARNDPEWFGKAADEMTKLRPLHLTGDAEQIAEFLGCGEFRRYKRDMSAKQSGWKFEGTLTVEP